ncbi:conjugative transposon protein TraM [Pseudochryseolinea flava]|uniref:Conjugative transposon TraM C-terminal domain-containing protein n=1 Tax=Pseudochryseolinea flava TaxID=2059302 RepID=A0A364XZ26_9BACT|nr:conjugative transposon protein TraM [Pseudochryseolinea flava]RAV98856.1 hypothetical protein DQQ10_21370 [Pseudochryseolinea flava]
MTPHTENYLRQRRFYMILPALVLPFLIMIFWALGGGQGTPAQAMENTPGLNPELPQAQLPDDDKEWNKLTLYDQAKRDSLKFEEARRSDPYFKFTHLTTSIDTGATRFVNSSLGEKNPADHTTSTSVENKLKQLYAEIDAATNSNDELSSNDIPADAVFPTDIAALQTQMASLTASEDPELAKIDNILDKLIRIQHPELVVSADSIHEDVHALRARGDDLGITNLSDSTEGELSVVHDDALVINRFYGLDDVSIDENPLPLEAEISQTQTITSGSTVALRILHDAVVSGKSLKAGSLIFGVCNLSGERLLISIKSVISDRTVYPVAISVYDLDGMEGIHVPGTLEGDIIRQSSNQSIQDLDLLSINPTMQAQLADTGLKAAKTFFNRKAKLIKVTVSAGHRVLLVDKGSRHGI